MATLLRRIAPQYFKHAAGSIFAAGVMLFQTSFALAGSVWLPGGGGISNVPTRSLQETKFAQVVRQQYDFSCGSAAIATLLTFHYELETDEQDAFEAMYEVGDKEKIAKAGFSLLDMKNYLESIGFSADGYQASLDTLENAGVPAIALINERGYRHFVVVKGIEGKEILIGDPALGLKYVSREVFESIWDNGILFIIKNQPEVGKQYFNQGREWQQLARAPLGKALPAESLAGLTVDLPRLGDF
jgi:predicted double-glycine peptidase